MCSCTIGIVGGVSLVVYFGQQLRRIKSKPRSSNDDGKMLARFIQLAITCVCFFVLASLIRCVHMIRQIFFDVDDDSLEGFHYQLWYTMTGVLYPILTVILFQWRFICIFKNTIYQVGQMMNIFLKISAIIKLILVVIIPINYFEFRTIVLALIFFVATIDATAYIVTFIKRIFDLFHNSKDQVIITVTPAVANSNDSKQPKQAKQAKEAKEEKDIQIQLALQLQTNKNYNLNMQTTVDAVQGARDCVRTCTYNTDRIRLSKQQQLLVHTTTTQVILYVVYVIVLILGIIVYISVLIFGDDKMIYNQNESVIIWDSLGFIRLFQVWSANVTVWFLVISFDFGARQYMCCCAGIHTAIVRICTKIAIQRIHKQYRASSTKNNQDRPGKLQMVNNHSNSVYQGNGM